MGVRKGLDLLQRPERVEAALWRRARLISDEAAVGQLFELYQDYARKIAQGEYARYRGAGAELAEVKQLAFEGLLQAIGSYDCTRGTPFPGYARKRIKGCITDGLARASERSAQYRYRQRAERDRLRSLQSGLRESGDALEELSKLANLIAIGLMLEESTSVDPDELAAAEPSAYETLAWCELRQRLTELVASLGERDRFVIAQHYTHGISFTRIAEVLGITKGRVSQLHKAALLRLRAELEKFK